MSNRNVSNSIRILVSQAEDQELCGCGCWKSHLLSVYRFEIDNRLKKRLVRFAFGAVNPVVALRMIRSTLSDHGLGPGKGFDV